MNYQGVTILKPWGFEYLQWQTPDVAVWMLRIKAEQKTSLHYHPSKDTSLVVLSGLVEVFNGSGGKTALRPGQSMNIAKGVAHSTYATVDSWVMEVESPPIKTDLVRVSDNYGRKGTPYESGDKIIEFSTAAAFPS